jgi:hypothetical protein
MTWRTSLIFVVLATSITMLVGWLSSNGLLPIHRTIEYSETALKLIRWWIILAFPIGLILPTIALIVWFKYPGSKTIFGFYLLLLITQIATEGIVSSVWLPSLVVVVGSLYTAFRVNDRLKPVESDFIPSL